MTANLAQRDEAVKRKNNKIKELKLQLSISQQEAKLRAKKAEEALVDRDAFWEQRVQVANMEAQLEERQRKVEQLEAQRRAWTEARSEHELTKTKLANLEEKLSRQQDQQQQQQQQLLLAAKKRVLADKTNDASTASSGGASNAAIGATVKDFAGARTSHTPAATALSASGLSSAATAKQAIKGFSGSGTGGRENNMRAVLPLADLL